LKPKNTPLKTITAEDRERGREKLDALRKRMKFNLKD